MDSTVPDDSSLVSQARGGDFAAFEELVNRHERRVYALAWRILRNQADAQDAVQQGFINAVDHLDSFRGEASFGTWIARIVTNTALKILRKNRGLPVFSMDAAAEAAEENDAPHPEFIAPWRLEPDQILDKQEVLQAIEAALDELPEKYRLVFLLRDVNGLSTAETAAALGLSEANTKVRLLRARLQLRERVTRLLGDEHARIQPPPRHPFRGKE